MVEAADDPIPYTLQYQDEATISNYNLIAKQHFPKVKTCYVIPRPSRTLRSKSGPPTDHNPTVLHLSLLAKSATQSTANIPMAQELPPPIPLIQTERPCCSAKFLRYAGGSG